MRHAVSRALLAVVLSLAVAASASAGWDEAVAAYNQGDYDTAYRELRGLAEQGHAEARFKLGMMYTAGSGVEQDRVQALMWLNLAAAAGVEPAREQRRQLAAAMTPAEVEEAELLADTLYPVNDVVDWKIVLILSLFVIAVVSGCSWAYFRYGKLKFNRDLFDLDKLKKVQFSLYKSKPESPRSAELEPPMGDVQNIVREFSAIAEALGSSEIRDVNELPRPKAEIRHAFKTAIARAAKARKIDEIQRLKITLVAIAQFQPDFGAALNDPLTEVPSGPVSDSEAEDLMAAAQRYSKAFQSDAYQRYLEFYPAVERETSALLAEAEAIEQSDFS